MNRYCSSKEFPRLGYERDYDFGCDWYPDSGHHKPPEKEPEGIILPYSGGYSSFLTVPEDPADPRFMVAVSAGDEFGFDGVPGTTTQDSSIQGQSFTTPRDIIITRMVATVAVEDIPANITNVAFRAQLYTAPNNTDIFTPIPGALVTIPSITSNQVASARRRVFIPIRIDTRVLYVFYATGTNTDAENEILFAKLSGSLMYI